MKRRKFLLAAAGTFAGLGGGTGIAKVRRADVVVDGELNRPKGEPASVTRTIDRESVEYLESTNEVVEHGHTAPFEKWARSECEEVGARGVLPVVERRLETSLEGVGSGVRYLPFGPVVTVDHTVTRNREGTVVSEPNVAFDRLVADAPRTLTVTVSLEGEELTRELPVGVGQAEVSMD